MKPRHILILETSVKESFEVLKKERDRIEDIEEFRKVIQRVIEQNSKKNWPRKRTCMLTLEEKERLFQLIENEIGDYKKSGLLNKNQVR